MGDWTVGELIIRLANERLYWPQVVRLGEVAFALLLTERAAVLETTGGAWPLVLYFRGMRVERTTDPYEISFGE